MKNLDKINTLRKLAKDFGNPMKSVDFIGEGARFVYAVGNTTSSYFYDNADRGILEEIERFNKLLAIDF